MMILSDIAKKNEYRYLLHCLALLSNFNDKGLKSKLITCNGQGVCNKDDTCQCNFQSKKLFNITASRFCKSIEQKFFHLKPKYSHRNSIFSNLKFCKVSIQYIVVISKWNIECRLSYYHNYFKNGPNYKSDIYFCYRALTCSPQNRVLSLLLCSLTKFHAHALWLLL